MTPVGAIFAVAFLGAWVFRPSLLVYVLAASVVFPQTAMIVLMGNGISPFYIGLIMIWLRIIYLLLRRSRPTAEVDRHNRQALLKPLILFISYGVIISLAGPFIFAGVKVFSPRLGIDGQVNYQSLLDFGLSNVAQTAYLVLGVAAVLYLDRETKVNFLVFEVAIFLGLTLVLLSLVFRGLWPNELFDNMPNIAYDQFSRRARGTFNEPSSFGLLLSASVAYIASRLPQSSGRMTAVYWVFLGIAIVEFGFSAAGTALVGMVGAGVLATVLWIIRLAPGRQNIPGWVVPVALALIVAIALFHNLLLRATVGLTDAKVGSESGSNRLAADLFTIPILRDTLGLGVGLGSHRPSSLLAMLLSCVGVVGTAAFIVLVVRAARGAWVHVETRPVMWAMLATIFAAVGSKPDLSEPIIWFTIGLAFRAATTATKPEPPPQPHKAGKHDISNAPTPEMSK